jgi:hypothetical protein
VARFNDSTGEAATEEASEEAARVNVAPKETVEMWE